MNFHASLIFVAFSASVTRPTFSHFLAHPSFLLVFPCCVYFDHSSWHGIFLFLSSHLMAKRGCLALRILFMSDLAVPSSCNTVLFDFFAVYKILSVFLSNHISVATSFCFSCFDIVQGSSFFKYNLCQ